MTTPINKILTSHKQTLSNSALANVSASLSAILGQGGGTYTGDGQYIDVNNNNTITMTQTAASLLNSVEYKLDTDIYAAASGKWEDVASAYKTYSGDYLTAVSSVSPLSGDGTTEHPLGVDMSSAYSIDGAHGITAIPNTANNKVIVQMTDDVWAYYQRLAASANVWDSASAISNKSKTVINNSVNTITTENSGTSATLSAVEYKVNTSFQNAAPKQLFVVQDDNDIYAKLSEVNGKGSLFFVCSAI